MQVRHDMANPVGQFLKFSPKQGSMLYDTVVPRVEDSRPDLEQKWKWWILSESHKRYGSVTMHLKFGD